MLHDSGYLFFDLGPDDLQAYVSCMAESPGEVGVYVRVWNGSPTTMLVTDQAGNTAAFGLHGSAFPMFLNETADPRVGYLRTTVVRGDDAWEITVHAVTVPASAECHVYSKVVTLSSPV
ncbi:MAG: hypothetical protein AB7Q42_13740 [Acidimicrobiia bacterium]